MQSNYIGPRVRRVLCKSKAGLSHFHTCKKQKLKKKVLKQYSGTLFSALRCLSLNRDLSGTPRAATWLLCLLSYRTPRTVWYPARWRRETGPSIHPNGHPSCKDSCSMIPVPCMWPTHHIARIFSGESIFFSWHAEVGTKRAPIDSDFSFSFFFSGVFIDKKLSRTIVAWLDTENEDVQNTSRWIYYNKPTVRNKLETFPRWSRWTSCNLMWS